MGSLATVRSCVTAAAVPNAPLRLFTGGTTGAARRVRGSTKSNPSQRHSHQICRLHPDTRDPGNTAPHPARKDPRSNLSFASPTPQPSPSVIPTEAVQPFLAHGCMYAGPRSEGIPATPHLPLEETRSDIYFRESFVPFRVAACPNFPNLTYFVIYISSTYRISPQNRGIPDLERRVLGTPLWNPAHA